MFHYARRRGYSMTTYFIHFTFRINLRQPFLYIIRSVMLYRKYTKNSQYTGVKKKKKKKYSWVLHIPKLNRAASSTHQQKTQNLRSKKMDETKLEMTREA